MTIKDLQLRRNDLAAEMRKMADLLTPEHPKFTAEQEEQWKKLNKEYDETRAAIEVKVTADKAHADTTAPSGNIGNAGKSDFDGNPANRQNTDGGSERDNRNAELIERDHQLAVRAWVLSKSDPDLVTEEHVRACRRFGISPRARHFDLRLSPNERSFRDKQRLFQLRRPDIAYLESRAQSTAVGSLGGYLVAPLFSAEIESAMLYYGPMMQVATPIRTSTAGNFPMPTDNETAATGAYTDQNETNTTEDNVSVGVINFGAYKVTSLVVKVPYEAFRDMAIDLNSYLADKLGERIGRFINTQCTTGSTKAKGIVTKATAGITSASSSAITFDEILGLQHSVDLAYRNRPGAGFMFHDTINLGVRKLKNGVGDYLWSNGTTADAPDRLCGKPYYINNDMASILVSGAIPMIFGDLAKYHIRTVGAIRLMVSDQAFWTSDQIAFQAYVEFDGDLVDAGTHPVKKLTQV